MKLHRALGQSQPQARRGSYSLLRAESDSQQPHVHFTHRGFHRCAAPLTHSNTNCHFTGMRRRPGPAPEREHWRLKPRVPRWRRPGPAPPPFYFYAPLVNVNVAFTFTMIDWDTTTVIKSSYRLSIRGCTDPVSIILYIYTRNSLVNYRCKEKSAAFGLI